MITFEEWLNKRDVKIVPVDADRGVNIPSSNKELWEHMWSSQSKRARTSEYQLTFLRDYAKLKPENTLLDIGCGWLRGGIHFIRYLKKGNYWGFDKEYRYLRPAVEYGLEMEGLLGKEPRIACVFDFEVEGFLGDMRFDFMVSYSVFSHISLDAIRKCMEKVVVPYLKDGGVYYTSYFIGSNVRDQGPHQWRFNEYSKILYPPEVFDSLGADLGLKVKHIGRENHPDRQVWVRFSK